MENEKKTPWGKIIKLIAEFIIAIITALTASSFVGYERTGIFLPERVSKMFSLLPDTANGFELPGKAGFLQETCWRAFPLKLCLSFDSVRTFTPSQRKFYAHKRPCSRYQVYRCNLSLSDHFCRFCRWPSWHRHCKNVYSPR